MPRLPSVIPSKGAYAAIRHDKPPIHVWPAVVTATSLAISGDAGVYAVLHIRAKGLTAREAALLLAAHGLNVLAKDQCPSLLKLLQRVVLNPLVILLAVLATIFFATGDLRAGTMMVLMIALSVGLKPYQESKDGNAAAKLKAMNSVTAAVMRDGTPTEIAVSQLVPGDVVQLAAGDMVPGDVGIISAKDLFVIEGSLIGESFPVEKFDTEKTAAREASAPTATALSSIAFRLDR